MTGKLEDQKDLAFASFKTLEVRKKPWGRSMGLKLEEERCELTMLIGNRSKLFCGILSLGNFQDTIQADKMFGTIIEWIKNQNILMLSSFFGEEK